MKIKNKKNLISFLITSCAILLFIGFLIELAVAVSTPPSSPPKVKTGGTTFISYNSAGLVGTVNPKGTSTVAWFEYGEDSDDLDNKTVEIDVGEGGNPVDFIKIIDEFDSSTTYYYRAAAKNSFGVQYGNIETFQTDLPPIMFTITSPAPGNKYFKLPIFLSASVVLPWCSNTLRNAVLKAYLDGNFIGEKNFGSLRGGGSVSYYSIISSPINVGRHQFRVDLYGDGKLMTSQSVNFEVVGPSIDIKANGQNGPITVELPNSYTLSWNGNYLSPGILQAFGDWSGSYLFPSSEVISAVRGYWQYGLSGKNDFATGSDSVLVKVIQVPRCNISVNPSTIILPEAADVSWSCQYADSCEIFTYLLKDGDGQFNDGDISVEVDNDIDYRSSGIVEVRPPSSAQYQLNCSGLDGDRRTDSNVLNIGFFPGLREVLPR